MGVALQDPARLRSSQTRQDIGSTDTFRRNDTTVALRSSLNIDSFYFLYNVLWHGNGWDDIGSTPPKTQASLSHVFVIEPVMSTNTKSSEGANKHESEEWDLRTGAHTTAFSFLFSLCITVHGMMH